MRNSFGASLPSDDHTKIRAREDGGNLRRHSSLFGALGARAPDADAAAEFETPADSPALSTRMRLSWPSPSALPLEHTPGACNPPTPASIFRPPRRAVRFRRLPSLHAHFAN